jgi:hypothetical protein
MCGVGDCVVLMTVLKCRFLYRLLMSAVMTTVVTIVLTIVLLIVLMIFTKFAIMPRSEISCVSTTITHTRTQPLHRPPRT